MLPAHAGSAVNTRGQDVAQQRFAIHPELAPFLRQLQVDPQIFVRDRKHSGRKVQGMRFFQITHQSLMVDLIGIMLCPQPDIADLPDAEPAADKMLIGVQDQIEQMILRRHRTNLRRAVFDFIFPRPVERVVKEALQFHRRPGSRRKQFLMQLNEQRAVRIAPSDLIINRRIGVVRARQPACPQDLTGLPERLRPHIDVFVRADPQIAFRPNRAANAALDDQRVDPSLFQLVINIQKLQRPPRLLHYIDSCRTLVISKLRPVFGCSGIANDVHKDRHQFLLCKQLWR